MGGSKKQTVGFWYRPVIHLGLHQGPYDAFLRIRGGDVDAWQGDLRGSGEIYVNAPEIWGGEDSEGGMVGPVDIMFGEPDQLPNAYFQGMVGADPSGHRGIATLLWKGGRYGAMNPYPKPLSVMTRRVKKGWNEDQCWFPETAEILLAPSSGRVSPFGIISSSVFIPSRDGIDWSADPVLISNTAPVDLIGMEDRYVLIGITGGGYTDDGENFVDATGDAFGGAGGFRTTVRRGGSILHSRGVAGGALQSDDRGASYRYVDFGVNMWGGILLDVAGALVNLDSGGRIWRSSELAGPWQETGVTEDFNISCGNASRFTIKAGGTAGDGSTKILTISAGGDSSADALPRTDRGAVSCIAARSVPECWVAGTSTGHLLYQRSSGAWQESAQRLASAVNDVTWIGTHWVAVANGQVAYSFDEGATWSVYNRPGIDFRKIAAATMDSRRAGLIAMNPAHVIYDSLTDPRMQGEPIALINDASFRAAASRLHAERFGICTFYDPDQETVEQFRQRICDLIGAQCSRSTVDGQWYLDLIRGDYDIESLPVLTDDDILEFQDDPTVLDDAVNQLAVQWFDPLTKQERMTAPVHSLGAIQAMGSIVAETNKYSEIPVESLAERVAARDLRNKSTPLWRKTIKTNRKPYAWRIGTQFRLMAPRHGVADMVCMVGDIDKGTLRSGAISMVALQDIFGMPDATYVVGQPDVLPEVREPRAASAQRVFEAPYVELVGVLPPAEVQGLDPLTGFLEVVGARPEGSVNYQLQVAPDGGAYAEAGIFDWCPTALAVDAATSTTTQLTLASASLLDRVEVGTGVLWGDEICRVDALDAAALTVTVARGCADTVPMPHPVGSRLWFYDTWAATDGQAYIAGEPVSAKLLTRVGSAMLDPASAPTGTVVMAGRASRPYPPGRFRVGADNAPLLGPFSVTWAHRDRLLQADQLVDTTQLSIGPEPSTRYGVRILRADTSAVLVERADIDGTSAQVNLSYTGEIVVELWAVSDNGPSQQRHRASVEYTSSGADQNVITAPTWTPVQIVIDGNDGP